MVLLPFVDLWNADRTECILVPDFFFRWKYQYSLSRVQRKQNADFAFTWLHQLNLTRLHSMVILQVWVIFLHKQGICHHVSREMVLLILFSLCILPITVACANACDAWTSIWVDNSFSLLIWTFSHFRLAQEIMEVIGEFCGIYIIFLHSFCIAVSLLVLIYLFWNTT